RKLIEAAHTEAWEILTEYRDVLDILAGELLEKETLHRAELKAIFEDVKKRPRLTMFDDFGGRVPSDKPPIKTPGELAIERGEPWPPPMQEPAFKAAIAAASKAAESRNGNNGVNGNGNGSHGGTNGSSSGPGGNGAPAGPTQPNYGAPAGWHAPGWPPQGPGQYPPPPPPSAWGPPPQQGGYPPQYQQPYPPYQPYPQPGQPAPRGSGSAPNPHDDEGHDDGPATPPAG
ncbi:MAG: cell division protein FtsH, partial [Mycolicibacterium sp.]|nr:cell division protein FtsH [Mycolicibacterium sp.]